MQDVDVTVRIVQLSFDFGQVEDCVDVVFKGHQEGARQKAADAAAILAKIAGQNIAGSYV